LRNSPEFLFGGNSFISPRFHFNRQPIYRQPLVHAHLPEIHRRGKAIFFAAFPFFVTASKRALV